MIANAFAFGATARPATHPATNRNLPGQALPIMSGNTRAERLLQWKQDGARAAAEYEAKERATRLLTAKLRTERLAREATSGKRCESVSK